jgi:hypothetical protein
MKSSVLRFTLLVLALGRALSGSTTTIPGAAPVVPDKVIVLYDGKTVKDLSQFYRWLGPLGKDNDPNQVFTVVDRVDGAPAIRVSGQDWGGIVTRQAWPSHGRLLFQSEGAEVFFRRIELHPLKN